MNKKTKGFSKFSKKQKLEWIANTHFKGNLQKVDFLKTYWNADEKIQKLHDEFSENTITNFYLPLGVVPNFLINGKNYTIPMAIEESSVVAAVCKTANFWFDKGGFKTKVIATQKIGHIHFSFNGNKDKLFSFFEIQIATLKENLFEITQNMEKRGGGVKSIKLIDKAHLEKDYYQIEMTFETVDSMGANFINSCLETTAEKFQNEFKNSSIEGEIQIIMCILSNYTPNCIVRSEVKCKIEDLGDIAGISSEVFAKKFAKAIRIAEIEPYRATTHNKGIFNGIDAVVIATGNDFRAVEACAHAYACKNGTYSSLTHINIENGIFHFWIDLPISVGTVGGLTQLHPMVKFCLEILKNPNSKELMKIIASVGLAQNFAAVKSLVTTGIQRGHMKMHLMNILNQLGATDQEKKYFVNYFKNKTVTHYEVVCAFNKKRIL